MVGGRFRVCAPIVQRSQFAGPECPLQPGGNSQMRATWRWFGPEDPMTIDWIRQAAATSVEASLTHLPPGTVWEREAIDEFARLVAAAPVGQTALAWDTL